MRYRTWLGRVALVSLIAVAAAHPWRAAVGAAPVVPGVGLADIELGMPITEVLVRFGTPSAVRLIGGDGLLGYGFDRYGITVYTRADVVQAVATTSSVLSVNGIRLGASTHEVMQALGPAYTPATVEGYPGVVYAGLGVAFGLDRDAVASMMVFRPMAATPAQQRPSPAAPATSQAPSVLTAIASVPAGFVPGKVVPSAATTPAGPASAPGTSPSLPDVSHLRPYSAETHFLSLTGYLRYLVHDVSKTWITTDQEQRLMQQNDNPGLR